MSGAACMRPDLIYRDPSGDIASGLSGVNVLQNTEAPIFGGSRGGRTPRSSTAFPLVTTTRGITPTPAIAAAARASYLPRVHLARAVGAPAAMKQAVRRRPGCGASGAGRNVASGEPSAPSIRFRGPRDAGCATACSCPAPNPRSPVIGTAVHQVADTCFPARHAGSSLEAEQLAETYDLGCPFSWRATLDSPSLFGQPAPGSSERKDRSWRALLPRPSTTSKAQITRTVI